MKGYSHSEAVSGGEISLQGYLLRKVLRKPLLQTGKENKERNEQEKEH